ncbi:MAG: HAMP domain-containing histidine kinase [Clostridia bacterium]|nr:HAMP domain-containing histidine kinase [Clostridia bacterium]
MRLKFLERTYLLTLILFLVFLNGGIFALALYTFEANLEAAEQISRSEQFTIVSAFERDAEDSESSTTHLLQVSYASFYAPKGIYLRFESAGEVTHSTLPPDLKIPEPGKMTGDRADGVRYILITQSICDDSLTLTYTKDVSYLDADFSRLIIAFAAASVVASSLLAILLYLLLRRLYSPLEKLSRVTQDIAGGSFHVRADESGDDEFAHLAADFNRMAERISNQMAELRDTADRRQRMLDDLAHEMRTPLTGIYGYAEYICTANIPKEEMLDAAGYIMSESNRLKRISETLLDSAFIRENKIEPYPCQIMSLLLDTRERHLASALSSGCEIRVMGEDATLSGDQLLLEMLLSNLTENAIKACEKKGIITLSCTKSEQYITLSVTDNGVGMTEEQLSHITEPFYRTDQSRSRSSRTGGTGLGLALCKRIAEAHGAVLEFSSHPGQGTTASVTFTTS